MYKDSLGILHDNLGNVICERCGKKASTVTMSWFNTQMICASCRRKEEQDPRIKQAKQAELEAIHNGNTNFPGIGY